MARLLILCLLAYFVKANPFLDIYLHVHPLEDICTTGLNCNITYALSILVSQNNFDLQSLKLQEGRMSRISTHKFEDNTVFRLNKDMFDRTDKIYLGLSMFDVPEGMQDFVIVDITNVINKGHKARVEFVTESMRTKVHVYRHHEALVSNEVEDNNLLDGCTCRDSTCSCCRYLKIRKLHLDNFVCINTTYVPSKEGFNTALTIRDQTPHFSKEILTGNSLPICFGMLREYATMCLRIYQFKRNEKEISFCTETEARLYHVKISRKKMGCLRLSIV